MVRKEGSYTTEETRLYYTGSRALHQEGPPRHGFWELVSPQVRDFMGPQVLGVG